MEKVLRITKCRRPPPQENSKDRTGEEMEQGSSGRAIPRRRRSRKRKQRP